ncbi:MAG: ABC transporter permease, partial [Oscillospiraceae bacterium]|nr:ABC transporter permease [Oscillospiraceae bacterium]
LVDDELTAFFADAPPELLQSFRELFGIIFNYGEFTSGFWFSALVLVVTTIVFYALSLLVIKMR